MNRFGAFRKQTLVVICSVVMISLIVVGVSYSSFSNIGDGTNNVVVENYPITATYKVSDIIETELLSLNDEEALDLDGSSFSLLNNSDLDITYYLYLENIATEEVLNPQYIKVSIDNNTPVLLDSLTKKDGKYQINSSILKKRNDIGDVTTHNIKMWASENSPVNKNVKFKISVESEIAHNVLSSLIMNLSKESSNTSVDMNTSGLLEDPFGNIHYYGANPNNYLIFNNEVWRIIGVFNTKTNENREETRVKIVKEEALANIPYSISDNYSWNNNLGNILSDYSSGVYNEYLNNIRISKDALNLIDYTIYNVGTLNNNENYHASDYYDNELNSFDNNGRENKLGIVAGLLNISDYCYASSDGLTGNYLNNGTDYWLMNYSNNINNAYYIDNLGNINLDNIKNSHNVRPTIYLKSTVAIESGDGSVSNPYVIK